MGEKTELRYWQIISQSLDLEDRKLRMFVKHKGSLGIGRESFLRKFLSEHTPDPYKINTGFMVHPQNFSVCSDQCDVLVYNPTKGQPYYQIQEFVVLDPETFRLAIEVRTNMSVASNKKKSGLDQVFKVYKSLQRCFPPNLYGFGYDGPSFETCLKGIVERMNGDIKNIPECIVVHRKNYIFIRAGKPNIKSPHEHVCIGIDFGPLGHAAQGFATAIFLRYYHQRIEHNAEHSAQIVAICARDAGVDADKLLVIRPDGTVVSGVDPDIALNS